VPTLTTRPDRPAAQTDRPYGLAGLSDSWSFKDSWVSNLTASSGLVIAVLGSSDVLKSVLGDDAEAAVGATTVAGAIALALTGAAGVVVLTIKKAGAKEINVAGLLAGSAIAFGAAGGQIWAVTLLLNDVDLGVAKLILWIAAVLASLLLLSYAFRSLLDVLITGTEPKADDSLSASVPSEIYAAAIGVAAGTGHGPVTFAEVEAILERLKPPTDKPKRAPARGPGGHDRNLVGRSALP
jgi:hypothetical protein